MFDVSVVAEIYRLAQRAASLRKHLKALAVEFRRCGKRQPQIKQHRMSYACLLTTSIHNSRMANGSVPAPLKFHSRNIDVGNSGNDIAGSIHQEVAKTPRPDSLRQRSRERR